jgi:hypothetical protein
MDASFRDGLTPSPWHADAVGGRPPHHPILAGAEDLLHRISTAMASMLSMRVTCLPEAAGLWVGAPVNT